MLFLVASHEAEIIMKLFIIVAYFLLRIYHSAAIELLVLPDGEEHSILCTAIITEEEEDSYQIILAANGQSIGDGFVVGEVETLDDGTRERNITFTATNDINNTNLSCVVVHLFQLSLSFTPIEFTIIIQGISYIHNVSHNLSL